MKSHAPLGGLAVLLAVAGWAPAHAAEPERPIAVIVAVDHAKNPRLQDVALIYRRKKLFWADGTKVNPVNLASADPLRRDFSEAVLGASPEDLQAYWNNLYFHGVSPPFVLSSEEAVLRFVAQTPGAIGYVSYCHVDSRVKVALVVTTSGLISEDAARIACSK
jgi:ABC-type phosphate transport system substrate-binding protein